MSKEKLRSENNCLNCDQKVEHRYCPHCGQENTVIRITFHHLFTHFFKDLTHYDNSFWRTIVYLLFKPAAVSKAYTSGKRKSFLAPMRLYIFTSFMTFFLISLFPAENAKIITGAKSKVENVVPKLDSLKIDEKGVDGLTKIGIISQGKNDTLKNILKNTKSINPEKITDFGYKSTKQLDWIQKNGSEKVKVGKTEYWFLKKWLAVKEENTNKEIVDKFGKSFVLNLPKVLFIYMPVFAFFLWLFHDKERWYFYDHGIFTLHLFSFLLLMILLLFFIDKLFTLIDSPFLGWINLIIQSIGLLWMVIYFFPAHRRFYGESHLVSGFKSSLVYALNLVIVSVLLVLYGLYTYINLH
ncbi:MAG: DUF3667 domain-containing protein [Lutibacter sp.]|nr:DUF3667 domain-containing protein [Lutibacter sp.]MDT8416245.1 DUF3667 domain-containing protein [Lutibacter sp.]